jgi:hypothetical protein
MNLKTIVAIGLLLLPLLITACNKSSDNPLSKSSDGSGVTGTLSGWAQLVDIHNHYLNDNSGITVTAEGTSFSATTAASGKWSITGLPSGTYTISFSKAGFGTYKEIGYQFVGGGNTYLPDVQMRSMPAGTIGSLSARALDTMAADTAGGPTERIKHIEVEASIQVSPAQVDSVGDVRLFIGLSNSVSSLPGSFAFFKDFYDEPGNLRGKLTIRREELAQYGIAPGTTLYLVACVINRSGTIYYDPDLHGLVYSSVSAPSSVVSVVVP